jgi:hypothetical protein
MNDKFQNVDTTALVAMLAQHTQQLTSLLLSAVNTKEYADCKKMMEELQFEIIFRQRKSDNRRSTLPDTPSQTDATI